MVIGIDASRANVTQRTGTERYAWEVIRRIAGQPSSHRFRLYVRESLLPDWPELPANVEVRVLTWKPGVLWSHLRLSWELFWHRPDILFIPADTVPLVHPKKTITTIHDVAFERFPELYQRRSVQRKLTWLRPFVALGVRLLTLGRYGASELDYHRWSVRHALRTCSRILTVSEFTKQELITLFQVPSSKIVVTPLGIDETISQPLTTTKTVSNVLSSFGLETSYILFIGRLEKKKNIRLIIQAYYQYRQLTEQPVDLVLIGNDGFGWDEAAEYIRRHHLEHVIHKLGWVSDEETRVIHAQAKALIFVSQYEGFGIPALLSLQLGVPVLASRHGSLPEVLGQAAVFVETTIEDVAHGIDQIVSNVDIRRKLIDLGQVRSAVYSWDRTASMTKAVILNEPLSEAA